jgi:hypothetical protein
VVGEEVLAFLSKIKRLWQGAGISAPFKSKGYFERRPHLFYLIVGAACAIGLVLLLKFKPPGRECQMVADAIPIAGDCYPNRNRAPADGMP